MPLPSGAENNQPHPATSRQRCYPCFHRHLHVAEANKHHPGHPQTSASGLLGQNLLLSHLEVKPLLPVLLPRLQQRIQQQNQAHNVPLLL